MLSRKVLSLTEPKGIKRNPSAIILQIVVNKNSSNLDAKFIKNLFSSYIKITYGSPCGFVGNLLNYDIVVRECKRANEDRTHLLLLKFKGYIYRHIALVGRVFANGPGDLGSIPGRIIPKTLKMVLDTSLLNTQQHKVRIKGKVEQTRERSSALPYTSL